jgi:hypothetical protein
MTMNMFWEILRTQWKWASGAVLFCAVAAFAIPILSVQGAVLEPQGLTAAQLHAVVTEHFLTSMERWGALYTFVAAGLGLAVAVIVWGADHRGRHVYALILPIERWRFVLLRFLAGASFIALPTAMLLLSSFIAIAMTAIPDGLHAYPVALAMRFGLAALVSFSLFFAISAGTARSAAVILAPIVVLVIADVLLQASGLRLSLVENSASALFEWPGILEVFTGRWILVDV